MGNVEHVPVVIGARPEIALLCAFICAALEPAEVERLAEVAEVYLEEGCPGELAMPLQWLLVTASDSSVAVKEASLRIDGDIDGGFDIFFGGPK